MGVKQLRDERDGAVKALRRTKAFKEEQAGKLTELSVGFESMVQVRGSSGDRPAALHTAAGRPRQLAALFGDQSCVLA